MQEDTEGADGGERPEQLPRVERLALEFDALCGDLEERLIRRAWAHNGQLQRTSASILSNVGEAFDAVHPAEQRQFFGYARRAAGEAERTLRGAHERGALTAPELRQALKLLRDIKHDLDRLIAWTLRSPP